MVIVLIALVLLSLVVPVSGQEPAAPPSGPPPQFEEQIEVVAVTPVHGLGLSTFKVPANVQLFTADPNGASPWTDIASQLGNRAVSVHTVDAQAGTFQPDLMFRGFAGSPLLGASEGLAVYQDGVRINEAFGDTVNWDVLPPVAIASMNLMPGSNPLFGLNALGGAVSIQTKDGFSHPGRRAVFTSGSFVRHRFEAQVGGHGQSLGYFLAGSLTDESGWRDFSPSTVRTMFGNVAWRSGAHAVAVSVTAASNDLTGNGPAPLGLLQQERNAVFTHPDLTENDTVLVTVNGRRQASAQLLLDGVAYYRRSNIRTFNGDAVDDDDEDAIDEDHFEAAEADHDDLLDAVNNISRTRAHSAGFTGQMTRTIPLLGRDNHFVAGGGLDAAATRFGFETERAQLTPDRGTTRTGIFDEDAAVDLESRSTTGSAFVTNTWSVTSRTALTGSARFNGTALRLRDQIGSELSGDHRFWRLNPSAGLTYQLRTALNVYGNYAQSSRVPTPVELTCADPDDPCRLPNAFVADPPLKQIVASTWEAGLRGRRVPVSWTLAVFTSAATDDIIFVSSGTLRGEGHFENVTRTTRRGIEAGFEYETARVSAFAAYTFQRAAFGTALRLASRLHPDAVLGEIAVEEGDRIPGVPLHSGKVGVTAKVTDRLDIGADVQGQASQFLRSDEANLLSPVPGFGVMNVRGRYRLTNRVIAVADARNVFDTRYYTFGVLGDPTLLDEAGDDPRFYSPGAPRAVWAGVEVRF